MKFNEKDLFYKDYPKLVAGDNLSYNGIKDRVKVNKKQKHEVAYFCEKFLKETNRHLTIGNFQYAEKLLRHNDLSFIQNREVLKEMIEERWHRYMLFVA